ncbi:hypothetical protein [Tepidimonas taiwanensis]|nr:hypothetical protein [Tepidimonas taiwanensis]
MALLEAKANEKSAVVSTDDQRQQPSDNSGAKLDERTNNAPRKSDAR